KRLRTVLCGHPNGREPEMGIGLGFMARVPGLVDKGGHGESRGGEPAEGDGGNVGLGILMAGHFPVRCAMAASSRLRSVVSPSSTRTHSSPRSSQDRKNIRSFAQAGCVPLA